MPVVGMGTPTSNVLFGRILDALNTNPGDPNVCSFYLTYVEVLEC
jgi:hypothetical protein